MAEESQRFSLSRWSRRKLDAKRAPATASDAPPAIPPSAPPAPAPEVVAPLAVAAAEPAAPVAAGEPEPPLPPVASLSIDSDFRPFMAPKVDEATKRAALRKLFSDPRFNVMDGLDVYIDDYNKPDPMPAGMLEKIVGVYDRLAAESAAQEAAEKAAAATLAANDTTSDLPVATASGGDASVAPPVDALGADESGAGEPTPDAETSGAPPTTPHA